MIKRFHIRGFRIIIWPHSFKLIQMVSTQHSPVPGQILKIVHDNSNEQVNDLKRYKTQEQVIRDLFFCKLSTLVVASLFISYQKSTESKEADEIQVGQIAATAVLLPWLIIRLRVTPSAWQCCQHNLLPLLSCCTSLVTKAASHYGKLFSQRVKSLYLYAENL